MLMVYFRSFSTLFKTCIIKRNGGGEGGGEGGPTPEYWQELLMEINNGKYIYISFCPLISPSLLF